MTGFFTIEEESFGEYKEKGSKFMAFGFHVQSLGEVEQRLSQLRKKHNTARHHCYAWVLGENGNSQRASDDGEPTYSAGEPIKNQILSRGLTNVLVVVIRYFGGIKLGVGGLKKAYKTAASECLHDSNVVKVEIFTHYKIMVENINSSKLISLIFEHHGILENEDYGISNSTLSFRISENNTVSFFNNLNFGFEQL